MFLASQADIVPFSSQPPVRSEWSSPSFRPGDFTQDIFTLPLELGLIGAINYAYTPRARTLFPFMEETTDKSSNTTTYSRSEVLPYAIGVGAAVFTGLTLCNDDFYLGTQVRGFSHALLLTELATSTAKAVVQKPRPNYSAELNKSPGQESNDMRASFFSGHASHAFAFASYTSLLMFEFSPSPLLASLYTVGALGAASVISYSRVQDHAHNLSDVLVGAFAGTAISTLVFFRTQNVDKELHPQMGSANAIKWDIAPSLAYDDAGRAWYSASFNLGL